MSAARAIRPLLRRQILMALGVAVGVTTAGCCMEKTSTHCVELEHDDFCPPADEVIADLGVEDVEEIEDGITYYPVETYEIGRRRLTQPAECCYEVSHGIECVAPSGMGRPYVEGRARHAALRPGDEGRWSSSLTAQPCDPERAARWTRRGQLEHAAIASLGRFALELMAHGADSDLVAAAHEAARDEVAHARIAFGMARAFGGEAMAPAGFPFGEAVPLAETLTELAVRTVQEAAVEETLGVVALAEELAASTSAVERRALSGILRDERRHAVLAWRTLRWAIRRGGEPLREAVVAAFAAERERLDRTLVALYDEVVASAVASL